MKPNTTRAWAVKCWKCKKPFIIKNELKRILCSTSESMTVNIFGHYFVVRIPSQICKQCVKILKNKTKEFSKEWWTK